MDAWTHGHSIHACAEWRWKTDQVVGAKAPAVGNPPKKEISMRQPFAYDLTRDLCVEEFARVGR